MKFKSKHDLFFIILFSSNSFLWLIALVVARSLLPLNQTIQGILTLVLVLVVVSWLSANYFIVYELQQNGLIIRNGPFVKRISYKQIDRAESVQFKLADVMTGNRVLSSKEGVILYYTTNFGKKSIKLSPMDKEVFLTELRKKVQK